MATVDDGVASVKVIRPASLFPPFVDLKHAIALVHLRPPLLHPLTSTLLPPRRP